MVVPEKGRPVQINQWAVGGMAILLTKLGGTVDKSLYATRAVPNRSIGEGLRAARPMIPASVRADGTVRRERKVKPGYVPAEEVPRYVAPPRRSAATTPTPPIDVADISPLDYHLYRYSLINGHYQIVREKETTASDTCRGSQP